MRQPYQDSYSSTASSTQFQNATMFLDSTPDDIITAPKMSFIKDVKNPCFAYTEDGKNPANVSLEEIVRNKWNKVCLPYVYLVGNLILVS